MKIDPTEPNKQLFPQTENIPENIPEEKTHRKLLVAAIIGAAVVLIAFVVLILLKTSPDGPSGPEDQTTVLIASVETVSPTPEVAEGTEKAEGETKEINQGLLTDRDGETAEDPAVPPAQETPEPEEEDKPGPEPTAEPTALPAWKAPERAAEDSPEPEPTPEPTAVPARVTPAPTEEKQTETSTPVPEVELRPGERRGSREIGMGELIAAMQQANDTDKSSDYSEFRQIDQLSQNDSQLVVTIRADYSVRNIDIVDSDGIRIPLTGKRNAYKTGWQTWNFSRQQGRKVESITITYTLENGTQMKETRDF